MEGTLLEAGWTVLQGYQEQMLRRGQWYRVVEGQGTPHRTVGEGRNVHMHRWVSNDDFQGVAPFYVMLTSSKYFIMHIFSKFIHG